MKKFIITVDTEPDGQWDMNSKGTIKNSAYIPRFQELCEQYNFKPVYLVDYKMLDSKEMIKFLNKCIKNGTCEVGMHLHAWDTPPYHYLDTSKNARPYLIEYPEEIMYEKIASLHEALSQNFETDIISHRAGRWAINAKYLKILDELNYKIDCSLTPGINWQKTKGAVSGGPDYSKVPKGTFWIDKTSILEVPMTVEKIHYSRNIFSIKELAKCILGRNVWLRPALYSVNEMDKVVKANESEFDEFMVHSSELMPGGSPYFTSENDIELLYERMNLFFEKISRTHEGQTLSEFYYTILKENKSNDF